MAPLRGMSGRVGAPISVSDVRIKNATAKTDDPLAPHYVIQDPMMSGLSSSVIAYIADMVSPQVQQ